jgi:hypothetical protein
LIAKEARFNADVALYLTLRLSAENSAPIVEAMGDVCVIIVNADRAQHTTFTCPSTGERRISIVTWQLSRHSLRLIIGKKMSPG